MIERGAEVTGVAVENFLFLPEPNGGLESAVVLVSILGAGLTVKVLGTRVSQKASVGGEDILRGGGGNK